MASSSNATAGASGGSDGHAGSGAGGVTLAAVRSQRLARLFQDPTIRWRVNGDDHRGLRSECFGPHTALELKYWVERAFGAGPTEAEYVMARQLCGLEAACGNKKPHPKMYKTLLSLLEFMADGDYAPVTKAMLDANRPPPFDWNATPAAAAVAAAAAAEAQAQVQQAAAARAAAQATAAEARSAAAAAAGRAAAAKPYTGAAALPGVVTAGAGTGSFVPGHAATAGGARPGFAGVGMGFGGAMSSSGYGSMGAAGGTRPGMGFGGCMGSYGYGMGLGGAMGGGSGAASAFLYEAGPTAAGMGSGVAGSVGYGAVQGGCGSALAFPFGGGASAAAGAMPGMGFKGAMGSSCGYGVGFGGAMGGGSGSSGPFVFRAGATAPAAAAGRFGARGGSSGAGCSGGFEGNGVGGFGGFPGGLGGVGGFCGAGNGFAGGFNGVGGVCGSGGFGIGSGGFASGAGGSGSGAGGRQQHHGQQQQQQQQQEQQTQHGQQAAFWLQPHPPPPQRVFDGCYFTLAAVTGHPDERRCRDIIRKHAGALYMEPASLPAGCAKVLAVCPPGLTIGQAQQLMAENGAFAAAKARVTWLWLVECLKAGELLALGPHMPCYAPLPHTLLLHAFAGVAITCSAFSGAAARHLEYTAKLLGGSACQGLSDNATHIIVPPRGRFMRPDSYRRLPLVKQAVEKQHKAVVVTSEWVTASAVAGRLLPVQEYTPEARWHKLMQQQGQQGQQAGAQAQQGQQGQQAQQGQQGQQAQRPEGQQQPDEEQHEEPGAQQTQQGQEGLQEGGQQGKQQQEQQAQQVQQGQERQEGEQVSSKRARSDDVTAAGGPSKRARSDGAAGTAAMAVQLTFGPVPQYDLVLCLEEIYSGCSRVVSHTRLALSSEGVDVQELRTLTIEVAPGAVDGTLFVFQGEGNAVGKQAAGPVAFVLKSRPHPRFTRRGADLLLKVKPLLWQATVPVHTLDGRVLHVAVECYPGACVKVPGEGMPKDGGGKGDLYVSFDGS